MTSAEFTESLAFEELEPDPLRVMSGQLATLLALMHNVYRDTRSRPKPYEVADFLPRQIEGEKEVQEQRRWTDTLAEMRTAYTQRQRTH